MTQFQQVRAFILTIILYLFAVEASLAENKVVVIPMAGDSAPHSLAVFADGPFKTVTESDTELVSVSLVAPSNGVVLVNSTMTLAESQEGDGVQCGITTATVVPLTHPQIWESPGGLANLGQLSGTRGFNVMGGIKYTFKLYCEHIGTASVSTNVNNSTLTALFTPTP